MNSRSHTLAAGTHLDRRRLTHWRSGAGVAFDHNGAITAITPRPCVHLRGRVAGIDGELHDREGGAGFGRIVRIQHAQELLPDLQLSRLPFEHLVVHRPGFLAPAPGHHFNFDAVFLDIDAGG